MPNEITPRPILTRLSQEAGAAWVRSQLEQGDGISAEVLRTWDPLSGVYTVLMSATPSTECFLFEDSLSIAIEEADAAVAQLLGSAARALSLGILVENDVMRRGDPSVDRLVLPAAFIGQRVVHWHKSIADAPRETVALLRRAATGYPTNGFLVPSAVVEPLQSHAELDEGWCRLVARSLVGIVTSAFDAESFVVWLEAPVAADIGAA